MTAPMSYQHSLMGTKWSFPVARDAEMKDTQEKVREVSNTFLLNPEEV